MNLWKETLEDPVEEIFSKKPKMLAICFDTLGQDREITEEDREKIF